MTKTTTHPGRGLTALIWILAVVITVTAVVYQRLVGPTRPIRGVGEVSGEAFRYRFKRSHPGPASYRVEVPSSMPTLGEMLRGKRTAPGGPALDPATRGILMHRRFNTDDPWTFTAMRREGGTLVGEIPAQPPGGKVAYRVHLFRGEGAAPNESSGGDWAMRSLRVEDVPAGAVAVPAAGSVVLRFTGHVPLAIIVPHVLLMFLGMLWSNRAGLEAMRRGADPTRLARGALDLLVVGGFVFGPLMQRFAFGKWWTGIPFGWDLTDNKTLFAVLGWLIAWFLARRARKSGDASRARIWVVAAALLTLVVFSIPHSVAGTELDYTTGKVVTTK
jgi:hypothetical protein